MASVAHVDNYKTIRKSVNTLNAKVENARQLNVVLDTELQEEINACTARLDAERNLRHEMAVQDVPSSTHADVEKLQELIDTASATKVENEYMEQASKLSKQMKGNIEAREILQMLVEYPERVYPDPPPVDAKGKPIKVKDDPKKKKKRKKREPPFPMPDWALELSAVQEKVKTIQNLVSNAKDLQLDKDFLEKEGEQMKRFRKEIDFRKQQEEEARLEAEAKAAAKKKKKK